MTHQLKSLRTSEEPWLTCRWGRRGRAERGDAQQTVDLQAGIQSASMLPAAGAAAADFEVDFVLRMEEEECR